MPQAPPVVDSSNPPPSFLPLLVPLLLSGAAGLTYQVLWLRLLSLVFGVTAYAATTVLASFMAGLALGSLLAGRWAARLRRPLMALGVAEILIASTALASPWLLDRLHVVYAAVHAATAESLGALTFARFACAFAVLLVPTTIMGATLPLVAASRAVRTGNVASRVGMVYATNTAGAIGGAFVTGFYLIGSVGIRASFLLAASCNGLAALILLAYARRGERTPDGLRPASADAPPAPPPGAARVPGAAGVRRSILVVFGLSGLAALALEVIWFRLLVLFLPATTYAFTAMLTAVLAGIAGGSWLASRLLRHERDWLLWLVDSLLATAILVVGSLGVLAWTYAAGWRPSGRPQASAVAILPATLLMGLAFPIALRLWARLDPQADGLARPDVAADLGTAYAVNVCGAIVGSVVGGFVLLPRLGSRASLIACAAVYLGSGLLLAWRHPRRRRVAIHAALAIAVFTGAAVSLPDPFLATLKRRHGPLESILWREEGIQTTVSVDVLPSGERVLYLDGLHQADDTPGTLLVHRQIGHLAMVLHRDPRAVLVIGLGGGATAGAVARHAGVEVDIVELSDSVRKGASFFAHANDDVLRQPRVRVRVDDGRNYLLTTPKRYDVITADIIQPIFAGAGLLYSVEYFRLARNALKEDGLMLQWVGQRPDTEYKLMVRTFLEAFPDMTLWAGGTLMVGAKEPLAIGRRGFDARLTDLQTRAALRDIGLDSFATLLSWYTAGSDEVRAFVGTGDILSDDRPRIEYHRSLPRERENVDLSPLKRDLGKLPVTDDE